MNETLEDYRAKRDFGITSEPEGKVRKSETGRLYMVHKHDARRLHYDLRLEMNGVLKSWAVPKGPSLKAGEKRLAVHVEDHPIEYGRFEGVIPKNEYGGGTVMLWDQGAWVPIGDPEKGYAKGHIKFRLLGRKLKGAWSLTRMGEPAGEGGKNWLLIKKKDAAARAESGFSEAESLSVATGRSMDEIARTKDRVWSAEEN
jgi:bifunctional non-homologous end joining protein LigD